MFDFLSTIENLVLWNPAIQTVNKVEFDDDNETASALEESEDSFESKDSVTASTTPPKGVSTSTSPPPPPPRPKRNFDEVSRLLVEEKNGIKAVYEVVDFVPKDR